MNKKQPGLKISLYRQHLKELINICRSTRLSNVQTYWHIGRRITEIEENPEIPSGYGSQMLHLFSKDLIQQFGKGYSVTNLKNMRTFYHTYDLEKLSPQIDWSSYTLLLSIKDPAERKKFENKIIKESLSHRQLKQEISTWRLLQSMEENKTISPYQLKFNRGSLYTYTLVNNPLLPSKKDRVTIDCGFNIHKTVMLNNSHIPKNSIIQSYKESNNYRLENAPDILPHQLYTYTTIIERVIDGDTILAVIDCGFHTALRMRLRLKGIDAPEIDTEEGVKARTFIEKVLKKSPVVGIKTYRPDKYSRYLADIFYLPGETSPHKVISGGIFLNQQLIDNGLAIKA
jgi:endonuclease YncB( thermonuclease family)